MTTGSDRVNATSLGTGTSKTLLGGGVLTLPDWAKNLVAVIPTVNIDVPTVGETVLAKLMLESDDFNVSPFEVLCSPLGACLGATVAPSVSKPEKYVVNCPIDGGKLSVYGQALVANTAAPLMSCVVIVSDTPPNKPQTYAKMGAITNTGIVATTEVAGTLFSFSAADRITELIGSFAPDTVAAADAFMGHIRFSSTEFAKVTPCKLELNPVPGGLSTIFPANIDGVSRQPVDIPVTPGQVNIQDYLYMDLAPAATGNWVSGVMYQARKRGGGIR